MDRDEWHNLGLDKVGAEDGASKSSSSSVAGAGSAKSGSARATGGADPKPS